MARAASQCKQPNRDGSRCRQPSLKGDCGRHTAGTGAGPAPAGVPGAGGPAPRRAPAGRREPRPVAAGQLVRLLGAEGGPVTVRVGPEGTEYTAACGADRTTVLRIFDPLGARSDEPASVDAHREAFRAAAKADPGAAPCVDGAGRGGAVVRIGGTEVPAMSFQRAEWDDRERSSCWEGEPPGFAGWEAMVKALPAAAPAGPDGPVIACALFSGSACEFPGEVVATDSYRASVIAPAAPMGVPPEGLLVPYEAMRRATSAAGQLGARGARLPVEVEVTDDRRGRTATITCGQVSAQVRIADGRYPPLGALVPKSSEPVCLVDDPAGAAKWLRAKKREAASAGEGDAPAVLRFPGGGKPPVLCAPHGDEVYGAPSSADSGPRADHVALNADYLADALSSFPAGTAASVQFPAAAAAGAGYLKPVVIAAAGRTFGDPGPRSLIMPVCLVTNRAKRAKEAAAA